MVVIFDAMQSAIYEIAQLILFSTQIQVSYFNYSKVSSYADFNYYIQESMKWNPDFSCLFRNDSNKITNSYRVKPIIMFSPWIFLLHAKRDAFDTHYSV